MILFLLTLLLGGYAVTWHGVPVWAYILVLVGTGWRAIDQWREREAQRRAHAEEAAKARLDDEIRARCERNGAGVAALSGAILLRVRLRLPRGVLSWRRLHYAEDGRIDIRVDGVCPAAPGASPWLTRLLLVSSPSSRSPGVALCL